MKVKRFLCYHLEGPWQLIWDENTAQLVSSPIPPAKVLGCCSKSYSCPICGFGVGTVPHHNCEGWEEENEM